MGKAAMRGLTTIWKDRESVGLLYGAETWMLRKAEGNTIDAFEMWCWRRVMRVSWMERKTNVRVLENKPEWTLKSRVAQAW